jgi:hypothetical protein
MKLFKDITQTQTPEKGPEKHYSQSRLYLFILVVGMFAVLTYTVLSDADVERLITVIDTLYYLIIVMSGYALSTKGFGHLKEIKDLR